MFAIMGAGAWIGLKLDRYYQNDFPAWLVGLSFFCFFGALYGVFKSLKHDADKEGRSN